jgi:PAS domain-containing protein
MDEEMRFHVDMEADRLARQGVEASEARRRAQMAFGARDKFREEMRDGRGLAWLSGLRLDLTLGFRMLVKYPLLTVVAGVAIVVATAIGVGATEFVRDLVAPDLPHDAREVLRTLNSIEKAIATSDGRWFSVRIMPYRTGDNRIDGLVITFTDITEAKILEADLREAQAVLQREAALRTARGPGHEGSAGNGG